MISEETPLENPYWQYSRDKKACEEYLMERYREDGFLITIVRPSHTYDERSVPLGVHGDKANSVVFDNSKVKRLVPEFKAEVSAEEGIRRTVENVLSHEEFQVDDEEFDKWCDDVIARVERI